MMTTKNVYCERSELVIKKFNIGLTDEENIQLEKLRMQCEKLDEEFVESFYEEDVKKNATKINKYLDR